MLELFNLSPQHDFHNRLVWTEDRPFDDHDYYVSGEKLEALGWRQRVPFTQGLRDTVEWYRGNMLDCGRGLRRGLALVWGILRPLFMGRSS